MSGKCTTFTNTPPVPLPLGLLESQPESLKPVGSGPRIWDRVQGINNSCPDSS